MARAAAGLSVCEVCWASFSNDEELAQHVEMERMIDWPIDGVSVEAADA